MTSTVRRKRKGHRQSSDRSFAEDHAWGFHDCGKYVGNKPNKRQLGQQWARFDELQNPGNDSRIVYIGIGAILDCEDWCTQSDA